MEVCCQDHGPSQHNNTMDNKESRREVVSESVIGLLLGLSVMVAGIWGGRQLHIVWNTWPCTDGVVVRGAVQEIVQAPHSKGGMPVRVYSPKIEFRYRVSGREYTTAAPSVYTADTYQKAAANLVRMYAPGTHHPIRYNPRDPRDIQFGIIEFGSLAFSFLLLIGGGVLFAAGSNSLAMVYSQRVERMPATDTGTLVTVMPRAERARQEGSAATIYCAACGRPVQANEDSCPNCLRSLRAA
jgi:hypothetical protein